MSQANPSSSVDVTKASELTGLSVHMITYLSRIDLIHPTAARGRGRRRRYSFNDVLFLKLVAQLLSRGIEVKRLGVALKRVRAEAELWTDVRAAPDRYLVTDGTEVFLRRKGQLESKTVDGQFAFAFVLDLDHANKALVAGWPTSVTDADAQVPPSEVV